MNNDLKFGKEMKMLMVVDTSLLPLNQRTMADQTKEENIRNLSFVHPVFESKRGSEKKTRIKNDNHL